MTDEDLIVLARCAAERKDSPMKPDEAVLMLELCRRVEALTVRKIDPNINLYGGIRGLVGPHVPAGVTSQIPQRSAT